MQNYIFAPATFCGRFQCTVEPAPPPIIRLINLTSQPHLLPTQKNQTFIHIIRTIITTSAFLWNRSINHHNRSRAKIADQCKCGWCPVTVLGTRHERECRRWKFWTCWRQWSRLIRRCAPKTWRPSETGTPIWPQTNITCCINRGSKNWRRWPYGSSVSSRRYSTRRTTTPSSKYVKPHLQ